MAGKFISASLLAVIALLSNSLSSDTVQASFNTVGQGIVRIELERKILNHFDNLQLEDKLDIDLTIDAPDLNVDQDLLLDSDEMNYSQLREL